MDFTGSPAEVYERVTRLDDDEFAGLMAEQDTRDKVIDTLVQHMATLYWGDPDVDAVLHVKLWPRPGVVTAHRALLFRDGPCPPTEGEPQHDPRLTLKVRPEDLRRIV